MEKLTALSFFPNPFEDPKYDKFDGLIELFSYIRRQPVPLVMFFNFRNLANSKTYKQDYAAARAEEKAKLADLTPDERLTRGLLRYEEGKTAITMYMKKEHSDENLRFFPP